MGKMKIAVVFHSVCGNTCQLAAEFASSLGELGAEVQLWRLPDPGYAVNSDAFAAAREYKDAITAIPTIDSPARLLDCDAIVMGSPTYFGNVSAPVKLFIDSFVDFYAAAPFVGKVFASFATAGTAQGGSDFTLLALNNFAMHVGMTVVSVPLSEVYPQPAYGLSHYSGDLSDIRMTEQEKLSVRQFARHFHNTVRALSVAEGEQAE